MGPRHFCLLINHAYSRSRSDWSSCQTYYLLVLCLCLVTKDVSDIWILAWGVGAHLGVVDLWNSAAKRTARVYVSLTGERFRDWIGLDWIEQCFTSPSTQYRLYGRRFLQVKRPNQQYQSTEGKKRFRDFGLSVCLCVYRNYRTQKSSMWISMKLRKLWAFIPNQKVVSFRYPWLISRGPIIKFN